MTTYDNIRRVVLLVMTVMFASQLLEREGTQLSDVHKIGFALLASSGVAALLMSYAQNRSKGFKALLALWAFGGAILGIGAIFIKW
ncbi:MAG: hypothetical protein WAX38_04315 [Minisyncoccia bacterium]